MTAVTSKKEVWPMYADPKSFWKGNFEVSRLLPCKDFLTAIDANCDLWKL